MSVTIPRCFFALPSGPIRRAGLVAAALLLSSSSTVGAERSGQQEDAGSLQRQVESLEQELSQAREEIASLRREYDRRFEELEERLAALSAAGTSPSEEAAEVSGEERAELEQELASILGESPQAPPAGAAPGSEQPSAGRRFSSQTRMLNRLNPEISVTGDVFGQVADRSGDPGANQFRFAEFEVAFQAPLDPFSQAKAFVVQEEGEFELEEGYLEWTSLPGGLGLKFGQYRQDFGKLNRWHQHALPQADRPLVHQAFLGEGGLKGLGVGVSWLPSPFLGDYNELWFQVTNDENDVAFSGRGFDQPLYVLHETNYWDLSSASYLEVGLSAATGVNDPDGERRTNLFGIDWNYDWRPPETALYRGLELKGELLWQRREERFGNVDALGLYTYGLYRFNRRLYLGLRFDWTENPTAPEQSLWGVSPYLEWWQSEWVRIRLQYAHNDRILGEPGEERFEPTSENKLFFQVTWSLGPHKHEKY